mmetsp:Transcript_31782/g.78808  ORF Transcript_31782/g.78808 Transcript_31782/m.78808 type:complete len:306 (-) Transcript_31782:711-1628(-)
MVLEAGGLLPLLQLLDESQEKMFILDNGTFLLEHLCGTRPLPEFDKVSAALPTLANLIKDHDSERVLTSACYALSCLSEGGHESVEALIHADGLCSRLVDLLQHDSDDVVTKALEAIGNIAGGDDRRTDAMLGCGVLASLPLVLSPKKGILKEACFTVSNIAAGTVPQMQGLIDAGLIPPMVAVLASDDEMRIKEHAARAIANFLAGGTPDQVQHVVQCGCVNPFCGLLDVMDDDVMSVAREALQSILQDYQTLCSTVSAKTRLTRTALLEMKTSAEVQDFMMRIKQESERLDKLYDAAVDTARG